MINMDDLRRLLDPIKRKIYLMLGRALLTAVNNAGKTQKIQVTALKDETISDIERFQEYGLETYPILGSAEALISFLNGNREQGIVICVHDREYRQKDLAAGDVRLYDYRNNRITHKSSGIEIEGLGAGALEFVVLASKLKTQVDALIDVFNAHVHLEHDGPSTQATATPMSKPAQSAYSSTKVKVN